MNAIDLNFTGVTRPKFEVVPEGEYTLMLSGCKVAPGKTDKSKMVASLVYEIVNHEEYAGKKILSWQVVSGPDNDMSYVKLWLESLIGSELSDDFTLDPDELVGMECQAFVGIVPDNRDSDKEQNTVKYYIPSF